MAWVLMCILQGMKDLTEFHRRSRMLDRERSVMQSDCATDKSHNLFPITSEDDFEVFESRLENRTFRSQLVSLLFGNCFFFKFKAFDFLLQVHELFLIGGSDWKKMVFNVMSYVIHKKLAASYTFDGKSGKKAFGKKMIAKIIKGP